MGFATADDAVGAYVASKAWQDTAAIISDDALYAVCHFVTAGVLSVREAARQTGLSKSSIAREMARIAEGKSNGAELTGRESPEMFAVIHQSVFGHPGDAPFERKPGEDGRPSVQWKTHQ